MRAASVWHSFKFAFAGIGYVFKTQRNAKIHAAITLVVIGLGLWLGIDSARWAILALTIGVVFAAEILNTAIEAIVDLVSPEYHPLAKIAKDAAAGSVLVPAIAAVAVGLLVLGPPLWQVLF